MSTQGARDYEAVFIYETGEEKVNATKNFVAEELTGSKIKILKEEDLGEKSLAYAIKHNDRGHYFRYELQSEPRALSEIEGAFKLRPEILKFLFFRKDS
jgi:small subunit ribosomal protein S6